MPERIVDLSPVITPSLPVDLWGPVLLDGYGFDHTTEFRHLVNEEPMYYKLSFITLFDHAGPHSDAPAHLIKGGKEIHEIPLDGFLGPARVFDFRQRADNEPILPEDFEDAGILPGDIVIAITGYEPPRSPDEIPSYSYLSGEAARYLASIPVRAFAMDAPSAASFLNIGALMEENPTLEHAAPEHHAFLTQEIPLIEGLENLEALVGEEHVVFVGFPLKIQGATGGLMRAAALLY
jgi:kynurenine formamidase